MRKGGSYTKDKNGDLKLIHRTGPAPERKPAKPAAKKPAAGATKK